MSLRTLTCLALVLISCAHSRKHNDRLRVSSFSDVGVRFNFFDLGQADAMLVIYNGHTLLMDAGESRERDDSERFHHIAKTLQSLTGSKHLDAFVISHYHRDHVGAASAQTGLWGIIGDGITIDTVYDRGDVIYGGAQKGETQREYERSMPGWLSDGKVKAHKVVSIGDTIDFGEGLDIRVVAVNGNDVLSGLAKNSPTEIEAFPASENDYSVALKFTYGEFELFAGGDLTGEDTHRDFKGHREGYHDIESSTAERVGAVEVYRANHHGSAHSSNRCFVGVLHPEVSIISSGANSYGHPTPVAYDALISMGKVFITGGADSKVRDHVEKSIVGNDVLVAVETGGDRFSVNGRDFKSRTEEEEAALPDHPTTCVEGGSGTRAEGAEPEKKPRKPRKKKEKEAAPADEAAPQPENDSDRAGEGTPPQL